MCCNSLGQKDAQTGSKVDRHFIFQVPVIWPITARWRE
jgi:hypothetical protein